MRATSPLPPNTLVAASMMPTSADQARSFSRRMNEANRLAREDEAREDRQRQDDVRAMTRAAESYGPFEKRAVRSTTHTPTSATSRSSRDDIAWSWSEAFARISGQARKPQDAQRRLRLGGVA